MKRRVIAIAVVLAAVGVVLNCEPIWRAVMWEKVLEVEEQGGIVYLYHAPRSHAPTGWRQSDGHVWKKLPSGVIAHFELDHGQLARGGFTTYWRTDGCVNHQYANGVQSYLIFPPWWPHPPLIDLREFEE